MYSLTIQMRRRDFLGILGFGLCGAFGYAVRGDNRGTNRPNVVIILADDLGFSDLGCYGGEIETPNIDNFATNGLRFTQFYNTGRCWPTRASLMSGYYAQQVRMDPPKGRLPKTRLLPHYLKPLGYRNYHSGKWHIRGAPRPVQDGGFDRSYMILDQDRFFSPRRTVLDDQNLPPVKDGTDYYATTKIADYGIKFLKEHSEKHTSQPFFLYLAFTCPHFPLHAFQKDIDRYRRCYLAGWDKVRKQRYQRLRETGIINCILSESDTDIVPSWNLSAEKLKAQIGKGESARAVPWSRLSEQQRSFQATKMAIHAAMVHRMDIETGRVVEQLRAMGAYENTVVFFLSDNGASAEQIIRGDRHDRNVPMGSAKSYLCVGPGWSTAANTPLRLHKSWVHEGGISTPLVVHWPRGISARGQLRHSIGHCIDFVPTILELTGAKTTKTWNGYKVPALPGKSLVPAFSQGGSIERKFLFFSHIGNHALRIGNWKLVSTRENENAWELYDLGSDRSESVNLASQYPERVRQMAELWKQLDTEFRTQAESP